MELDTKQGNTKAILDSFLKITNPPPSLHQLQILIDSSNPKLALLLQVIGYLKTVKNLEPRFSVEFAGWSDSDILEVSSGLAEHNTVTNLQLTLPAETICYDFLICFPLLKRLTVYFGKGAMEKGYLVEKRQHKIGLGHKLKSYIYNDEKFLGVDEPDEYDKDAMEFMQRARVYNEGRDWQDYLNANNVSDDEEEGEGLEEEIGVNDEADDNEDEQAEAEDFSGDDENEHEVEDESMEEEEEQEEEDYFDEEENA